MYSPETKKKLISAQVPASETTQNNVNCRLISPSARDYRNQLQKRTLLIGSRGCKAWITVVLSGLSFGKCVAVLALDLVHSVS
jgi:hypothetical protein